MVFFGPMSGTPYKIYAVEAGSRGLSLPAFLVISIPARGIRFVAVALVALWLVQGPLESWSDGRLYTLAVGFWSVFYVLYFRVKGI